MKRDRTIKNSVALLHKHTLSHTGLPEQIKQSPRLRQAWSFLTLLLSKRVIPAFNKQHPERRATVCVLPGSQRKHPPLTSSSRPRERFALLSKSTVSWTSGAYVSSTPPARLQHHAAPWPADLGWSEAGGCCQDSIFNSVLLTLTVTQTLFYKSKRVTVITLSETFPRPGKILSCGSHTCLLIRDCKWYQAELFFQSVAFP